MLKIQNHKKLLGAKLYGSGNSGSNCWQVTSIMEHLHHYVIFIENDELGWDRKVVLYRQRARIKNGYLYKLECGTTYIYLERGNIKSANIFSNSLESLLSTC
jgi:hypothetical protein